MQTQNDFEPSWVAEENDAKHREETAPLLFGDGSIDLQDPLPVASSGDVEKPDNDDENDGLSTSKRRQRRTGGGKSKGTKEYGSLDPKSTSGSKRDPADDGDDDTTDGDLESNAEKKQQQQQQGENKSTSLSSLFSTTNFIAKKKQTSTKAAKKSTGAVAADATASPQNIAPLTAAALRAKPHVPGINPCLWLFHTLQGVCVVAALMLCVTQVIPLVLAAREKNAGGLLSTVGWASVALKAYITSFCLVFVAVEIDLPIPFLRDSNLFQRYLSRGFLYSFLGLICLEEAYSERVRDIVKKSSSLDNVGWAAIFMQLSSWLMLAVGGLYMLMGVCCLKGLRDRLKEKEQREWREYREALKRWKDVYT